MAKSYDELLKGVTPAIRREALRKASADQRAIDAANIVKAMRRSAKLSQQQLAALLHVKQPAIAKMERQNDMKLSTLIELVRSVNGSAWLQVKMPNRRKMQIPLG